MCRTSMCISFLFLVGDGEVDAIMAVASRIVEEPLSAYQQSQSSRVGRPPSVSASSRRYSAPDVDAGSWLFDRYLP
jgi:hypothetical protein